MRDNFLDKRIPTLVGLTVLLVGVLLTTSLVKKGNPIDIRAGASSDPKNVQISNISDSSFTASYTTDDAVIGSLHYGVDPSNLDNVVLDDRDQTTQSVNKYTVHHITARGLSPDTTYYFSISSADKNYLNNDSAYKILTGNSLTNTPPEQNPMTGKIITPEGTAPSESLVYVTLNGAQKISSFTKPDGSYTIPLNSLRNGSLNDYFLLEEDSIINIEVNTNNASSSVSVLANQINPVPTITLSNSYDFSSPIEASPSAQDNSQTSFPEAGEVNKSEGPQILNPENNEEFSDQQPKFEGTALPDETVEVEIHSDENIKTQITASSNGKWSFRPSSPLSPGEHTITIKTKNKQGIIQTITQSFVVFASGTQVNENATVSATLTPSRTPTPKSTSTPTPSPAVSPTPDQTAEISKSPTLLPTGPSSVIIAGIMGVGAIATGLIILLLPKRNPL